MNYATGVSSGIISAHFIEVISTYLVFETIRNEMISVQLHWSDSESDHHTKLKLKMTICGS